VNGGTVAAVDFGASSGRVILAHFQPSRLELEEVHRFPNDPVSITDGLHWDVLRLHHELVRGLGISVQKASLASIGIDSWAVDFGLLDAGGLLLGNPYHYRDGRNAAGVERVHGLVGPKELYSRTGIQFLPFNTLYQLDAGRPAGTHTVLLIPDLFGYWLTGQIAAEVTNASTTGLLDARSRQWDSELMDRLELPRALFPELREPGSLLGPLSPSIAAEVGAETPVVQVASHDTASAVVAMPSIDDGAAYISCGTWALVGLELESPVLTEESRVANFTNEAGADGRVRYLRNVMGLWLLQESLRAWGLERPASLDSLLVEAAALPAGGPVFDPDDPLLFPPGNMPARIAEMCRRGDVAAPSTSAQVVRSILDSLAAAFARALRKAAELSGRDVRTIHLLGGGSRNELLCQLTADACELPVVAGPAEATAIGNALLQARTQRLRTGDLETLRALVRQSIPLRRFEPRPQRSPHSGQAAHPG
jgi:rhamnulokinase